MHICYSAIALNDNVNFIETAQLICFNAISIAVKLIFSGYLIRQKKEEEEKEEEKKRKREEEEEKNKKKMKKKEEEAI